MRRFQINGLQVLHHAIRILRDQNMSLEDGLSEMVNLLTFAWQYPAITVARIQIEKQEFRSNKFSNPLRLQSSKFCLANGNQGVIEIGYLKTTPAEDEGPFLKAERALLDSIAEILPWALDRRNAEAALRLKEDALLSSSEYIRDLAGRLIEAQEAERSRIARELQDSVNQQIAAVSISLSNIKRRVSAVNGEISTELAALQKKIFDIGEGIRHVSHELHPGILQHAGLPAAIRSACSKFAEQHKIEIDASISNEFDAIPLNIAVCVYRVVQEAFHNIGSHSKANRVNLILIQEKEHWSLKIADNGCGFRFEEARKKGGLGLIWMDERVRMFHGSLTIDTNPESGTIIYVKIPRTYEK